MTLVYLDTETTGLDSTRHSVWEIAYAVDNESIQSSFVRHSLDNADPFALSLNGYLTRNPAGYGAGHHQLEGVQFEANLKQALRGATLVGANPAFDAGFLKARWGEAPWHYRLLDVEAYAAGVLGLAVPLGLKGLTDVLREKGYTIPEPDHTAAADVATLRVVHNALQRHRAGLK